MILYALFHILYNIGVSSHSLQYRGVIHDQFLILLHHSSTIASVICDNMLSMCVSSSVVSSSDCADTIVILTLASFALNHLKVFIAVVLDIMLIRQYVSFFCVGSDEYIVIHNHNHHNTSLMSFVLRVFIVGLYYKFYLERQ